MTDWQKKFKKMEKNLKEFKEEQLREKAEIEREEEIEEVEEMIELCEGTLEENAAQSTIDWFLWKTFDFGEIQKQKIMDKVKKETGFNRRALNKRRKEIIEETYQEEFDEANGWDQIKKIFESSDYDKTEALKRTARFLNEKFNFKCLEDTETLWVFTNPTYEIKGRTFVKERLEENLENYLKKKDKEEIIESLRNKNYIERKSIRNKKKYIPLKNGWYNLEEDELQDPDPDIFMTNSIPWEYDEDASCEKVKEFLHDVVEDEDVKVLQEMMGYCLYRDYPIAKAFMLLGSGKNGKSTFLNLVERFLGENNIANPSLHTLVENQFSVIELYNKLANIHADLSGGDIDDLGNFKMLTGGDTIRGEKKFKQRKIRFKNYAKLIYSANELPYIKQTSYADWRRWVIVDFPYKFTEEDDEHKDKDPNILDEIIVDEQMSGLFNWVLKGLKRVLENGDFSNTEKTEEIKEEWLTRTNPLEVFVEKYTEQSEGEYILKDELYKYYLIFCEKYGSSSLDKNVVARKIPKMEPKVQGRRPKIDGSRTKIWDGLKFKENLTKLDDELSVRDVRVKNKSNARGKKKSKNKNTPSSILLDFESNPDIPDTNKVILATLKNMEDEGSDSTVFFDDLLNELEENGMDRSEAEERIDKLIQDGKIFEPKPGQLKTT